MAFDPQTLLTALRSLGFYDFLLPWLFTFAIVYGLLNVAKPFGEANKKVSTALALVVAFFVTGYAGTMLSNFFINIFGGASIVIAGILVILLFVGMFGYNLKDLPKAGALAVLVIVGIVLWFLSVGAAQGVGYLTLMSPDLIALILIVVVIVLAVWMIVRGGEEKKEERPPGK
jgi:hypothetical protein